jgi:23S rRNA pseudouridine2605 synthase
MNSNEHPDNELPSAPPGPVDAADTAAPLPAKRRARKSSTDAAEGLSEGSMPEGGVDESPAPKPRRRQSVLPAVVGFGPVSAESIAAPETAFATPDHTTAVLTHTQGVPESLADPQVVLPESGSAPQSAEGSEAADAPRRGRNRRRGRGKDRGERDAAGDESGLLEVCLLYTSDAADDM